MFDIYGNHRLTEWKHIRDDIETTTNPLTLVAVLWARAPLVNPFIDPTDPESWPDPWHLVLDDRYDDLAVVLGMLYTIKLTQRFMDSYCEIHMSVRDEKSDPEFFLIVDNTMVLNYEPRKAVDIHHLKHDSKIIWSGTTIQ